MPKYVAFLRGINVGGHHKVPMAHLCNEFESMGFSNIITVLNSGNIIFDSDNKSVENLESGVSDHLKSVYGFAIPTIVRSAGEIWELFELAPFRDVAVTKDTRLYVSFLQGEHSPDIAQPWHSPDRSYSIIGNYRNTIISVLYMAVTSTPNSMDSLEKKFGRNITTRNWNTIERIIKKLPVDKK